jgi:hypothetical protein
MMKHDILYLADRIAEKFQHAGVTADCSAFTVAVHDIAESVDELRERLTPGLLETEIDSSDEALGLVIGMIGHFDHIRSHIEDAMPYMIALRQFLEQR